MLSYRGPNAAGGVSNALNQIFSHKDNSIEWWYLNGDDLTRKTVHLEQRLDTLGQSLLARHYQYCNNFLWPILHDLPEFARYCAIERQYYRNFN
ncbi:MAG TPA: hypothetical protein V6C72_07185, partial [Chroococcales cyanobacterium]